MGQLFTSGGQRIGASASTSVLPMNIQNWFPLGWTGWTSLQSKGLSRVFSNNPVQKHQFFGAQLSLWSNSHIHTWLLGKTIALTTWTFVGKVMSLLFSMLSRLVMAKQYLWAFFATLSRWEKLTVCCPRAGRLQTSWDQRVVMLTRDFLPSAKQKNVHKLITPSLKLLTTPSRVGQTCFSGSLCLPKQ